MSTEENKALVRRFYDEVTNGRNVAVLDELLAANFEGFTVEGADDGQNREEFKHMISMVLNAFPDHHQVIHEWIAENDKVVTRWTAQGTHQGEYAGIAPTGKQVTITGMDIFRVVDSKIVEVWAEVDMLGVRQQLEPQDHHETPYTATPRRDLESLIADLYASPPLAVVTGVADGVMEVFGTATPLFAEDSWKVETEHWHVHSLVSVVRGCASSVVRVDMVVLGPRCCASTCSMLETPRCYASTSPNATMLRDALSQSGSSAMRTSREGMANAMDRRW